MDKVATRMEHCPGENILSENESIQSLEDKRAELWDTFIHRIDKRVTAAIASKIIQKHWEDEFIKSWQKLVSNPKDRLVVSDPENVKFYENCTKLVDAILKFRFADKQVERNPPNNLELKRIQELDNQIKHLKRESKKRDRKK
jgi:hypothetical protein